MSSRPAFTLLEVLLVIAVMAIILSASVPVYRTLITRNDTDLTASTITQAMRRAQILAQGQSGDQSWGVHIGDGKVTVFRGAGYAIDHTWDEDTNLPNGVSVSGLTDVVFAKMTGLPSATGTLTVTAEGGVTKVVTVEGSGLVSN